VAAVSSFQSVDSNALAGVSDRVPPAVTISCGSGPCSTAWSRTQVTVSINAADSGTGVKSITYVLDGASTTITGSTTAFTLGEGAHSISYSATDQAGNSSATFTQGVNVDSTAPTVSAVTICDTSGLVPPANAGWLGQGTAYRVLATLSDATSGIGSATASVSVTGNGVIAAGVSLSQQTVSCGGQSYTYASGPVSAPALLGQGAGKMSATVTALDVAGNSASGSMTGGVDDTAPQVTGFKATPGAGHSGQLTLTWAGMDALSGLAGYQLDVYLAGTTTRAPQYPNPILLASASTSQVVGLSSGTRYDFELMAVDNAGNDSLAASQLNKRAP
jgi:large repetitive protein